MRYKVGDKASVTRIITDHDIQEFAELTGDYNPVHTSSEYAGKTRFGRKIAHGVFSLAMISSLLGTKLPGPGTIYLSQTVKFIAPIFPEDSITAEVEVLEIRSDKQILTLSTVCKNQDLVTIVEGEAKVLFEDIGENAI